MPVSIRPTMLGLVFFAEGSLCASMGDPFGANPYQPGTAQHDNWQQGWSWAKPAGASVASPEASA